MWSGNPIGRSGHRFTALGLQWLDCWLVTPGQQHSRKLTSKSAKAFLLSIANDVRFTNMDSNKQTAYITKRVFCYCKKNILRVCWLFSIFYLYKSQIYRRSTSKLVSCVYYYVGRSSNTCKKQNSVTSQMASLCNHVQMHIFMLCIMLLLTFLYCAAKSL